MDNISKFQIYSIIENLDDTTLFKYIVVFVLAIFYFQMKNINLNIIFGVFVAVVVVYYMYDKRVTDELTEHREDNIKLNNINPLTELIKNKKDVYNFLFSIQDMYHYNPRAYEEMVDNIDAFLDIYDRIDKSKNLCEYNYQIAESKKDNAVNSLQSIIHSLPDNKDIVDKLVRSHKRLNTVLHDYLEKIYNECYSDTVKKGYHVHRRAINLGPKEANHYFDTDYSYQFY